LTKAANRILAVCEKAFHAEVRGRLAPEKSVQFAKLTDAEMFKGQNTPAPGDGCFATRSET
jgi:hypothetical protein